MFSSILRFAAVSLIISSSTYLQAAPDISNLANCINEVRKAESSAPAVPNFDPYKKNYSKLLADLEKAKDSLPHVYQEAAAKPLIAFLQNLGETEFLRIFKGAPTDENSAVLQEILPDAVLGVLFHESVFTIGVNAFQEIASDLYDSFLSDEARVSRQSGSPIEAPTYGVIPPLVKFGNADYGPYTWPTDATNQILGMGCAVVSLPPAQISGGLLAWSALGHETAGHDVTHADEGLLDELAQKVHDAVLSKFKSSSLANYWARCIDESSADVLGYLNVGPSQGIGLIGYFRALGDGSLRSTGSADDPHPIDLLRGYLAANVVKRLKFKGASEWSKIILAETEKDKKALYLIDQNGRRRAFPVSYAKAVESTDLVAQVIMQTKLSSLQGHSLQELQDWKDEDQNNVELLVTTFKNNGNLPDALSGPGYNAGYVIAAATQYGLQQGANLPNAFKKMQTFLAQMHQQNPTWSTSPTAESRAYLDQRFRSAPLLKRSLSSIVHRRQR